MIFKEVIEQILFESGLDKKELADELGISFLQIENLRTGVTKLPGERIRDRITSFCKEKWIDIDINWNDVLYDIFSESEQFDGYSWVRDLDEDGYVVLKHKACGKKTFVPKESFGYKSSPCIHCWVDKYVSKDSYEVITSEDTYKHQFTHKCGHSYSVTYEEIKQKKFRCPRCNGYKYNADNLKSVNTATRRFESSPSISIWSDLTKQRIETMADEYGFFIEERNTLHCILHYPAMTKLQFALVCNTCFDSKVFDKKDDVLQNVLDYLIKHKNECEPREYCVLEATKQQKIIWIPDVERILHMVALTSQGDNGIYKIIDKFSGENYSKEVYIGGITAPDEKNTVYLFYHYFNDNDEAEYVNLLISLTPDSFGEMTFYAYPKTYTDLIFEQIKLSMDKRVLNAEALQKSCDEYIDIVNYFKRYNQQIYLYAAFSKVADKLGALTKEVIVSQRQKDAEQVLSLQHCPVCQNLHHSNDGTCKDCGFNELNRMFINKDEYQMWLNDVVLPARKKREN